MLQFRSLKFSLYQLPFKNSSSKISGILLVLIITIFLIVECIALPAPLSAEQLFKKSDVIAKVKVLGVINAGEQQNATKYQAWLKILKSSKGQLQNNETIIVTWNIFHKKMIGNWAISYYPGETLDTHLVWDHQEKTYRTLSWNSTAVTNMPIQPNNKLPIKMGNVNLALDYCGNSSNLNIMHNNK